MPPLSVFPHDLTRSAALAGIGVVSSAFLLHTVDRPAAVWVLPLAWAWGAGVLLGLRAPVRAEPAAWLFAVALLIRLPLVGTPPLLSDDLYRYIWEGLASLAGHDVFMTPPASIDGLDDALRAKVNHPEVPSVYPPLALWWFRAVSVVREPWFVQLASAVADATVPLSIAAASASRRAAWVYALHPLPILESACGAHIDVPAVALAAAAIAVYRNGALGGALGLTAAAALTKLFPIVWVPTLARRLPPGPLVGWAAAILLGTVLVSIPFVPREWPAGWVAYATRWEFNGFVYPWLVPWLDGDGARRVLVCVGGGMTVFAWVRFRDPAQVWAWVGSAFVFLAPTLHPWYVLWALVPNLMLGRFAWGWASLVLLNGYAVLAAYDPTNGTWAEAPWLWWITWPPAVLLLLVVRSPTTTPPESR